jgi:hypothetical protein
VPWQCSRELELVSPGHTEHLIVSGRRETKSNLRSSSETPDGKEVATLQLGTVRGECVDFVRRVQTTPNPLASPPARVAADKDDVSMFSCPLALHPDKSFIEEEDHVEATALADRAIDLDPEFGGLMHDGCFSDRALLIRRQHRQRILVV